MRRIICVCAALITFAAMGKITWAQRPAGPVRGSGTAGKIPVWLESKTLGNSNMDQNADGGITTVVETGVAFFGENSDSNNAAAVIGQNAALNGEGAGVLGLSSTVGGSGVSGFTSSNGDGANGVFGEASAATGGTFGVQGVSLSSGGVGVQGSSISTGVAGLNQTCRTSGCTFVPGTAGLFATGTGGSILQGFVGTSGSPTGSSSRVFRVDDTGKGFFDGGTQTGGADFAESVAVANRSSGYEPGDLLILDTTADRQLRLSSETYSTLVAGIYSTKPGVLATNHKIDSPVSAREVPLAIVGIVPCKVTAENGPIQRGDLLVTSSIPGYAMKGTDRSRMLGAVVGKAMEPLANGYGVIQVLVTLQ